MIRRRWRTLLPIAAVGSVLGLWAARVRQEQALEPLWRELQTPGAAETFDPAMLAGLPAPAQRYLRRAIAPGTPLARSARLTMHGTLRLSPGGDALPMRVWRDAASGYVRFDVELSGERTFGGYTVPTRLRAGWRLGEPDAFPFFDATLDTVEYR